MTSGITHLFTLFHLGGFKFKTSFVESSENTELFKYSSSWSCVMLIHSLFGKSCDLQFINTCDFILFKSALTSRDSEISSAPPWIFSVALSFSSISFNHLFSASKYDNNSRQHAHTSWWRKKVFIEIEKLTANFHLLKHWKHCMVHPQNNMVDIWWLWCHIVDYFPSI